MPRIAAKKKIALIKRKSVRTRSKDRNEKLLIAFGARIREYRLERGLLQSDLASLIAVGREYISDIERGKRAPSLLMLEVFADGLQVSMADLVTALQ